MILGVAAAGLFLQKQMEQNLHFVRINTRLTTASTQWSAAWALCLAGDWARAEAFLWQLLEKEPAHPTFLMLLALAQAQRGKIHSAILNAGKAVSLQPNEYEHTKMMARFLLDAGRLKECEKRMSAIGSRADSDPEIAMLLLRIHLLRRQFDAALDAARALQRADGSPRWLIRIGEQFESAGSDQHAAEFYEAVRSAGYYPESLLGLARLNAKRGDKQEAKQFILAAFNVEEPAGTGGRPANDLFHVSVHQLMWLEEPREDCIAWIVTLPAHASPSALAQRSLLVYARNRGTAELQTNVVLSAMTPSTRVTPAGNLQWREAPKHQQPARPVREGIQSVL